MRNMRMKHNEVPNGCKGEISVDDMRITYEMTKVKGVPTDIYVLEATASGVGLVNDPFALLVRLHEMIEMANKPKPV